MKKLCLKTATVLSALQMMQQIVVLDCNLIVILQYNTIQYLLITYVMIFDVNV